MSANNVNIAEKQRRVYDAGHKAAIERYCPEFMESGAVVTCEPIEGFPLKVVSHIAPIQAGSGDASPTNVRPITGHTGVKVTIANETDSAEYNAEFGQDVYAGTYDWSTGLLTLTHRHITVTGNESWNVTNDHIMNYSYCNDAKKGTKWLYGWCSHTKSTANGGIDSGDYQIGKGYVGGYLMFWASYGYWDLPENTGEAMLAYVQAQAEAGTPIQIVYELETPLTVQLTPQEILALSGMNTIQSTTCDTTVTFRGKSAGGFTPLVQTIPLADLMFGYGVSTTKNAENGFYVSSSSSRTICPYFIPIDAGGTYRIDWEGDTSVKIGAEAYNTATTHRVALGSGISNVDMKDFGWGTSGGEPYTITIPETINGTPADTIRVMFNAGSGVTGDITITRIK